MALGVVEKIIERHMLNGKRTPGGDVIIKIDQTLTQDATGTMAYLEFEALGVPRVKPELCVSYIDHNTRQNGFENADDHRYLQSVAAKYGIHFSRPGNGICHQVHLERFARPGKTLLGADSHTPTAGAMAMLAMGAGGLDVAVALAKAEYTFRYPRIIRVNLEGKLKPWVSAKDVILTILKILTSKGNVGSVIEYTGGGLKNLSVPERATIANMGAETGVTSSVFPSDELTLAFLKAQGRQEQWEEVKADKEAKYDRSIEIDLGEVVPMLACPHSPDNVVTVKEAAGKPVDQVIIGSCANSSYRDLKAAASILKGKKIPAHVGLVIAPGSRQVLKMIADEGILSSLIEAGARIDECVCGFCIGSGQAPATGAVSVRTSNRNFRGRSGTESALVYLASPETAAAAAASGVISDPRDLKTGLSSLESPEAFPIDDSMIIPPCFLRKTKRGGIIPPASGSEKVKICPASSCPKAERESGRGGVYRGPNIGGPPASEPLEDTIKAMIVIKVGDKISTDEIMPAGAKLKYRSNIPRYAESVFEPIDPDFPKRAGENKSRGYSNIIVAGSSYGQGSSREHAAICPMFLGVKAVIAKSFERIHAANLINFGILPLTFSKANDYGRLKAGDVVELPDVRKKIGRGEKPVLKNKTRDAEMELNYDLTEKEVKVILAGGLLNYMKG